MCIMWSIPDNICVGSFRKGYPIRIKVSHISDMDITCTLYAGELLH